MATSSVATGLADQVPAGHAGIGRAVGHELGDVLGAHENGFELAAERCGERALAGRPDFEAGVVEQVAGVLTEAALVGQRDSEHGEI